MWLLMPDKLLFFSEEWLWYMFSLSDRLESRILSGIIAVDSPDEVGVENRDEWAVFFQKCCKVPVLIV